MKLIGSRTKLILGIIFVAVSYLLYQEPLSPLFSAIVSLAFGIFLLFSSLYSYLGTKISNKSGKPYYIYGAVGWFLAIFIILLLLILSYLSWGSNGFSDMSYGVMPLIGFLIISSAMFLSPIPLIILLFCAAVFFYKYKKQSKKLQ